MVCSSYKKGSGHSFALHPFQTHVSQHVSDVFCGTARFEFRVHTLRFETATWDQRTNSPTCVILMISKMSSMFFSTAPISIKDFSSQEICISVSPNRSPRRVYFLKPRAFFPFMGELLFMSRLLLAVALLDWRPVLLKPCKTKANNRKCLLIICF